MSTSMITSKGQITIPAVVRAALGVHSGDKIEFVELAAGEFLIVPATRSITALKGLIAKPLQPVSIEEMNQAIEQQGMSAQ